MITQGARSASKAHIWFEDQVAGGDTVIRMMDVDVERLTIAPSGQDLMSGDNRICRISESVDVLITGTEVPVDGEAWERLYREMGSTMPVITRGGSE